jgi:hypothetical protein
MNYFSMASLNAYEMEKLAKEGLLKEAECGVKYAITSATNRAYPNDSVVVKVWVGKAKKPCVNYLVKDEATAMNYVTKAVENAKERTERKAKDKANYKEAAKKLLESLTVGSLLKYSWGYEQTNVEFFEVVAKNAASVTVRPIAGRTVEATGPDSSRVAAVKGAFIGPAFTKRVTNGYGLPMAHGTARPTTEDETHHCSWGY